MGFYALMNARTGELLALMDARVLTAKRTAATSALAAGFLERHVEAGEGFELFFIEGDALGLDEDFFGGEVVGGHELALAEFAEVLKSFEGHSTKIH